MQASPSKKSNTSTVCNHNFRLMQTEMWTVFIKIIRQNSLLSPVSCLFGWDRTFAGLVAAC